MADEIPPSPLPPRLLLDQMKAALDEEALRSLCFQLGEEYEDLGGRGRQANARELITRMERLERYEELVATFHRLVLEQPEHLDAHAAQKVRLDLARQRLAALPVEQVPSPALLPPHSRMPLHANPLFVGREADLHQLAVVLKGGETVAIGQVAAATGMGGIGKTQLASEFVHRYGQYFVGGVFWISFAEPDGVALEVAACGESGALALWPAATSLPLEQQVKLVQAAWQKELPRLLVFDNCEDEELLARWRPTSGGCRVLLTSRRATWSQTLAGQLLPLGVLARPESVAFLGKHRPDLVGNPVLDAIAERLGDLPLALHLAGSYLSTQRHNRRLGDPHYYLEQLARPDLLSHLSMQGHGAIWSPTDHEQHVGRTFELSYRQLNNRQRQDRLAWVILNQAAWLAPGELIPRELLLAGVKGKQRSETDLLHRDEALRRLVNLGLIEQAEDGALVLHRLLARFVLSQPTHWLTALESLVFRGFCRLMGGGIPPKSLAQGSMERILSNKARPPDPTEYPALPPGWEVHLRYVTDAARGRVEPGAADLCAIFGYYLEGQGRYAEALPYYERALAICEQVRPRHADMVQALNGMGLILDHLAAHAAALPYLERAVVLEGQVLRPDHPFAGQSLNNLALVLSNLGDKAAARPYYERALAAYEKQYGPMHSATALVLNNIGAGLLEQGEYEEARPYLERALAIREAKLRPTHPDVAQGLTNWGRLLDTSGDPTAAHPCLERALAIYEQEFGPTHPETAGGLSNLAMTQFRLGERQVALANLTRALAIYEAALGVDHPYTQGVKLNLLLLQKQPRR